MIREELSWFDVDRRICVLLADVSSSMTYDNMRTINSFLHKYVKDIEGDNLLRQSVETELIAFGKDVREVVAFSNISVMASLPSLDVDNGTIDETCMNEAFLFALRRVKERKLYFMENGINYYRPVIFLMTDGFATDVKLQDIAQQQMKEAITERCVVFYPIAIGDDLNTATSLQAYGTDSQVMFPAGEVNLGMVFRFGLDPNRHP